MKSRSSTRTNGNGVLSAAATAAASHRPGNGNGTSSSSFSAPSELGKEALSRKSFAWVDRVSNPDTQIKALEVRQAYRMFYPVHQPSLYGFPLPKGQPQPCKKNCKFNPRCYCALGEGLWTDTSPASSDIDDEDLLEADNDERRPNFLPAGLRNLGNTCYVNSFLQIWFHNPSFRQAMYGWDPRHDPKEAENRTLNDPSRYKPLGTAANLQALFALMEFTNRRAVNPKHLVTMLGLDTGIQQDAQEFSKLFLTKLEKNFELQKDPMLKTFIQDQFRGDYAYVTKCNKCKMEKCNPSEFSELDLTLQGNKTLAECLKAFLKSEKLDGDNKYFCGNCDSKQNATRCVRLTKLPPVLNLQLNRFYFDM